MGYCVNCGVLIVEGAKYCQKCGTPVSSRESGFDLRTHEFAGKVYKCPNCGEILKSFETNCPSCGLELRGTKATNSVREFALKLEAIEAKREYENPRGLLNQALAYQHITKTDAQKISLIKNFTVPNTKEDILEFMILATSNIDTTMYGSTNTPTAGAKALSQAWNSKMKQVYAKAKNSYGKESDFLRIQELYDSCYSEIKEEKKKKALKLLLLIGSMLIIVGVFPVIVIISGNKQNQEEEVRLDSVVIAIETAIDIEDYRTALMNAEMLVYNGNKSERKQYWSIRQKYYIDEILEEAENHGIILNYKPSTDEAQDTATENTSGGFVQGFQEGLNHGLDAAKENIEQFNAIINSIGEDENIAEMESTG